MGFNFRKSKDFEKGSKSRKMSAGFLNELSALPIREKRSWIWWIMMDFTYLNWLTRICSSGSRSKLHYNSNSFQNVQFSRQKSDVRTLRKRTVEASCSPSRRRLKTKESLPCFDGLAADGDLQERKPLVSTSTAILLQLWLLLFFFLYYWPLKGILPHACKSHNVSSVPLLPSCFLLPFMPFQFSGRARIICPPFVAKSFSVQTKRILWGFTEWGKSTFTYYFKEKCHIAIQCTKFEIT